VKGRRKSILTSDSVPVRESGKKGVSSKIEYTDKKEKISTSLLQYRKSINDKSEEVKREALRICGGDLLSVKFALWGALQRVEEMMKERREG